MVSDLTSSSCRLPASDMLRTRSVRMRCLLSSEKMPTKVSQPVKLFMFSNSVPNTLVASSSPMIRSAMLPSITFCCLMTSSMRAFSMSKSAAPIFLSVWAIVSSTVPDCSILERISSTTCLVLAISASKF